MLLFEWSNPVASTVVFVEFQLSYALLESVTGRLIQFSFIDD